MVVANTSLLRYSCIYGRENFYSIVTLDFLRNLWMCPKS